MDKRFILYFLITAGLFFSVSFVFAADCPPGQLCNPLSGVENFGTLLEKIFTAVAGIVGAIAVIMLIIAGLLFVTSAGNPEKVNNAKKALTYAIIGIIVALAASAIIATVKWVIGAP